MQASWNRATGWSNLHLPAFRGPVRTRKAAPQPNALQPLPSHPQGWGSASQPVPPLPLFLSLPKLHPALGAPSAWCRKGFTKILISAQLQAALQIRFVLYF